MKKVFAKAALAMAALFAVGLLVGLDSGPLQAKQADTGATTERATPKLPVRVKGTARATVRVPSNQIVVTSPRSGASYLRGRSRGLFNIIWTYQGGASAADRGNFRLKLLRTSDTSWSVDLGSGHIGIMASNAYVRSWTIPADFPTGIDFYVRVTHTPSGAASHSKRFAVKD